MKALLAIATIVSATPLLAEPPSGGGAANPEQPRVICRRVEALSGSHVSRQRICRTAAQWRALSDTSADDTMDRLRALGSTENQPLDGYTSSRCSPCGLPPH